MINLVLKDLFLQKRMLGIMFLYIFLFSFAFKGMEGGQLIATIVAVSYMFVMTGCAWEEKNSSDVLWNSLPVPQWKIVGAKYLSILAYVGLIVPAYWLTSQVISLLRLPLTTIPVNAVDVFGGTVVVVVISSLYLPVFYGLGYTKSRYWNFLLFFGFFFLATTLPSLMPEMPTWLKSALNSLQGSLDETVVLSMMGTVVVVVLAISFAASLLLYRRREF